MSDMLQLVVRCAPQLVGTLDDVMVEFSPASMSDMLQLVVSCALDSSATLHDVMVELSQR